MEKNKSEIKIGAILSYIIIGLNMITGLLYTPILTNKLGQSEYGLYSLVSTVISYLTILDFGFGNAIIIYTSKYRVKSEKDKEQRLHGMFIIIYTIIGIVAGILGVIIALNVEKIFGSKMTNEEIIKAKILMLILSINLFFTFVFSIYSSIITAYEKFIFQKIINIVRILLQPLIMLVLLHFGYKSIALVIVISILNITTLFTNMLYCKFRLRVKMKFGKFNKGLFIEIAVYSIWIFLNMIMDKINWSLDQSILGIVSGTLAVSIYAIGSQIDQMYMNFSGAISGVLLPKVVKMEENDSSNEEFSDIFIKTGRIQYIVLALIMSGFIIYGKEFVTIMWVGNEYQLSYYVALILMISTTFPLIQNIGLSILQAKNKYKYRVMVLLIFAIFNIIISIFLSKILGAPGAALGTAVSQIAGQGIFMNWFYYTKIHLDIPKFWKEIIKMTIPIVFICFASIILKKIWIINSTIVLITQIIMYSLVYIVVIYNFSMNGYERDLFLKPIKKFCKLSRSE